ncbi:hypothetical protein N7471_010599 [Penicillium samsonianum]|uniref:uncharacterized protein n=1 Tax=Penicillium samsonianum TaxID=1882272 RepID=UPI0025468CA5|nr:uncharacterized protein N7471_010599 [Penicillium samsonianum]KAJ6126106.1 hypothetical protein N7471_010599 [Penicillium samsonianum]
MAGMTHGTVAHLEYHSAILDILAGRELLLLEIETNTGQVNYVVTRVSSGASPSKWDDLV